MFVRSAQSVAIIVKHILATVHTDESVKGFIHDFVMARFLFKYEHAQMPVFCSGPGRHLDRVTALGVLRAAVVEGVVIALVGDEDVGGHGEVCITVEGTGCN